LQNIFIIGKVAVVMHVIDLIQSKPY